jgi:L-2,4-diaminobutyrate decarboxylase
MADMQIPAYANDREVFESVRKELSNLLHDMPSIAGWTESDETLMSMATTEDVAKIKAKSTPSSSPRALGDVIEDAREIFSFRQRVNHPKFLAFIPSAPSPVSWLGDLINSAFNSFAGSWMGGSGVSTVELSLVAWLAEQIGLPPSAGGTFVSGASTANLSGLVLARDQILGQDRDSLVKARIYISDQAHFCIMKALRILGFDAQQVRVIPSDAEFRMDINELRKSIDSDLTHNLKPFLIVASCGTTNTGSIDPLIPISKITSANNMWLHVDAAYAASVALVPAYRHLLAGLERADSVAWDAHKWLFQTYGCGIVLARDKAHLLKSFSQSAEYVRGLDGDEEMPNLWNYGIELTRPARHMRLWFTLQVLGVENISQMIKHGIILAEKTELELRQRPGWEILTPAFLSILNFRYSLPGLSEKDVEDVNKLISREMIERNKAVIMTTRLKGILCLRICVNNPRTTPGDIKEVIADLDRIATEICKTLSDAIVDSKSSR